MATFPRLRATGVVVVVTALAVGGCGSSGSGSRTLVGPVTTIGDGRVCVGGPAASGDCFVRDAATTGLQVDDCVRVTYWQGDPSAPQTAAAVQSLDAASHPDECPAIEARSSEPIEDEHPSPGVP